MIFSAANYSPPGDGTFAYDVWKSNSVGFPAIGQSWVDPIFNESILRLTNVFPADLHSDIYSKNGWFNADATYFLHRNVDAINDVLNTVTGAVAYANVPWGDISESDILFDPVDPDLYYYWEGAVLKSYRLSTATSTTIHTFPSALQPLGGTNDWIEISGRYFVLRWGDNAQVYDKQTDTVFSGAVPVATAIDTNNGYAGISPNGAYLLVYGPQHYSYLIDLVGQVLGTTQTEYWNLGGGHSDVLSASDGKTYTVCFESNSSPEQVRGRDVSIAATSVSEQRANSILLLDGLDTTNDGGHFSCVSKGVHKNWAFLSFYANDDLFNNQGTWRTYKAEILMLHVLTGEVRRLCHHRSRSVNAVYQYNPRLCASWDGTKIAWASNYNYDNGTGYADIYIMNVRYPSMRPPVVERAASSSRPGRPGVVDRPSAGSRPRLIGDDP